LLHLALDLRYRSRNQACLDEMVGLLQVLETMAFQVSKNVTIQDYHNYQILVVPFDPSEETCSMDPFYYQIVEASCFAFLVESFLTFLVVSYPVSMEVSYFADLCQAVRTMFQLLMGTLPCYRLPTRLVLLLVLILLQVCHLQPPARIPCPIIPTSF